MVVKIISLHVYISGTTHQVINACTYGRENECKRIAFKEYSKFGITTLSSLGTGVAGSAIGLSMCAAIGIATAGTGAIVCAAVGSIAGSYLGAKSIEVVMDSIYDYMEM